VLEVAEVPYDPAPADREVEVARIVSACSALLEAAIRRSPAEWVWMHERWKTQPGPESIASAMPKTREVSGF
jgi:KDO2-lipid IV(A) lauroyltransferase